MSDVDFGTDRDGVRVSFDPASLHTVVAGRTRSGKSVTVYSILADCAALPWVRLTGLDPSGILLGPASAGKPDDFALGTSPAALEHAISVLKNVESLMDKRIANLMRLGVDHIPISVSRDERVGAVLLVLEEYAGTLASASKFGGVEIRRIVGRVLREGSKAAVHCLTVMQRPESTLLHDRGQYARAIVMGLENADSVRMLLPGATPHQVAQLIRAKTGQGFFAEASQPTRFFRADFTPYITYNARMRIHSAQKLPLFGANSLDHNVSLVVREDSDEID